MSPPLQLTRASEGGHVVRRRAGLRLQSAVLFLISAAYAFGLQQMMRPLTPDGLYFHPWSSETMMQTVSLSHLREAPVRTLLNIHIQPPAFDTIRALLALPFGRLEDEAAVKEVDRALYILGAVLLCVLVGVVFRWLTRYGPATAWVGALLVLLHPASIFFATFLDSTLLSSVLVTLAYFLLWKIKNDQPSSVLSFSLVVLALFFTRSIFQWPAILIFAISLWLVGAGRRAAAAFLLTTGLVAGSYLAKQAFQFGLLTTSSFSGISLANSIGMGFDTETYTGYLDRIGDGAADQLSLPAVLTSKTKVNGEPNFNNIAYLELNRQLLARYSNGLRDGSAGQLAGSYLENTLIYFMPTSTYSHHIIADRLPWTHLYNTVFSAPVLPALLLMSFIIWAARAARSQALRKSMGILVPGLFIFALCVFGDKGENMRFKFWLEPVMVVFMVSQFHGLAQLLRGRVASLTENK